MAKNKTHVVRQPKGNSNLKVGVITVEQQRTMQRAASRQAQIDSGVKVGSGAGVHGGNKEQTRRRDRREGKKAVRQEV
ncbi:MAG: hypothetical protein WC714_29590 [Candidatus Obscuribacterales bacterium]|jgi:hypothetical protein